MHRIKWRIVLKYFSKTNDAFEYIENIENQIYSIECAAQNIIRLYYVLLLPSSIRKREKNRPNKVSINNM